VLKNTTSTSVAYEENGAYWYRYDTRSFGFSKNSYIDIRNVDFATSDPDYRLNWNIGGSSGGYRLGNLFPLNNNSNYFKIII
jgi:hypothetical protein